MTALNSEGLEKARDAFYGGPGKNFANPPVGALEAAISAYLSALPPVDGLEVVTWDVAPKGLPAEPTKSHSFVAEIEKQGGVISPLVTRSQASSVIAGLTAERDEAINNCHDWFNVSQDRMARIYSLEEALKPFAMAADGRKSKGYGGGILFRQDVLLAARQVLEDHNG